MLGELCADAWAGRYDPWTAEYVAAAAGETVPLDMVTGGPALAQCTAMLRKSQRFGGPIGRLALAVNAGDAPQAEACLTEENDGAVVWRQKATQSHVLDLAVKGRAGAEGGYSSYLSLAHARPGAGSAIPHVDWAKSVLSAFDRFRILCAVREGEWGVEGLNEAVEARLMREKLVLRTGE